MPTRAAHTAVSHSVFSYPPGWHPWRFLAEVTEVEEVNCDEAGLGVSPVKQS